MAFALTTGAIVSIFFMAWGLALFVRESAPAARTTLGVLSWICAVGVIVVAPVVIVLAALRVLGWF